MARPASSSCVLAANSEGEGESLDKGQPKTAGSRKCPSLSVGRKFAGHRHSEAFRSDNQKRRETPISLLLILVIFNPRPTFWRLI